MPSRLPLKLKFNDDIRRFTVEGDRCNDYSLCDLKRDIRQIYKHANLPLLCKLYYQDEGIT